VVKALAQHSFQPCCPCPASCCSQPLQIQQALAVDAMSALTQQLYAWVNNTAGGDSAADADGGTAMDESGTESTTAPDVLGLPAAGHTRMAAFGAHLMLVLEALGVLPSGQYLLQPRPSLFSSNNGIENRMAAERWDQQGDALGFPCRWDGSHVRQSVRHALPMGVGVQAPAMQATSQVDHHPSIQIMLDASQHAA
jgi:hypothetical protein